LNVSPLEILTIVFYVLIILFSLSFHESAHAYVADKLGDPTARMLGRVTLNPIPHIDILGTIIVPLAMAIFHGPIFGWAKPVPTISRNFKNVRRDEALTALAGPASNLLLVFVGTLILIVIQAVIGRAALHNQLNTQYSIGWGVFMFAYLNLILAAFNLIPVPPLDGSWILSAVLPYKASQAYESIRRYAWIFLLIIFLTPIFNPVLFFVLRTLSIGLIFYPLHLAGMVMG
jgi:Zn-dependent protease